MKDCYCPGCCQRRAAKQYQERYGDWIARTEALALAYLFMPVGRGLRYAR